jgi:uncharacterized protein involved in exopolysaccharide biosynthesis
MPPPTVQWGPSLYVELLRSRALLEPLVAETFSVLELDRRDVPLTSLLEIEDGSPRVRLELGVRRLRSLIAPAELTALNGVRVSVTTAWPSVSLAIAQRLVSGVNQFNTQIRQSQATAERRFVATQVAEAAIALNNAEANLRAFLERNRAIGASPELAFEQDRLERELSFRQELNLSLRRNLEDAGIREVRSTPVVTVLEEPRLPAVARSRRTLLKAIAGSLAGMLVGVLTSLGIHGLRRARQSRNSEHREFFALVDQTWLRALHK